MCLNQVYVWCEFKSQAVVQIYLNWCWSISGASFSVKNHLKGESEKYEFEWQFSWYLYIQYIIISITAYHSIHRIS
jgi:hypothetical protein